MTRRVLAVAMAVPTVLLAAPARLTGDPAGPRSTSTTTKPAAADSPRLYPRRPGARYDDVEARADGTLDVGFSHLRIVRREILSGSARPKDLAPAAVGAYRRAALVDGYAPSINRTSGDLLHVVIRATPAITPSPVICVATFARDGIVRVPYSTRSTSPRPSASTTSTSEPPIIDTPVDLPFFFPIGANRGRVYITCAANDGSSPDGIGLFGAGGRPVWGLDV